VIVVTANVYNARPRLVMASIYEWLPRMGCKACERTRYRMARRDGQVHVVSCAVCNNTGYVGEERPMDDLVLAIDLAWGDEMHARLIGPNTKRKRGEGLHRLHVCGERS
jgi:hypothetical protein